MPLLNELPGLAFVFVLLLGRVGSACMLLPGIGEIELPTPIRAGFAFAFVALLMPLLSAGMPALPLDVWQLAAMIGAEIATGLWMGWLTRLMLQVLPVAGQFMAGVTGLANVIQPDPAMGPQTSAISHALALAAPVAVFATGLHALPIAALVRSYELIPAGALLPAIDTATQVIGVLGDAFAVALQLAAPFVLVATLWQFALGLLSRLVPQMQVYFAAMPGQIAGGLFLFMLLAHGMLTMWQGYMHDALAALPGL